MPENSVSGKLASSATTETLTTVINNIISRITEISNHRSSKINAGPLEHPPYMNLPLIESVVNFYSDRDRKQGAIRPHLVKPLTQLKIYRRITEISNQRSSKINAGLSEHPPYMNLPLIESAVNFYSDRDRKRGAIGPHLVKPLTQLKIYRRITGNQILKSNF